MQRNFNNILYQQMRRGNTTTHQIQTIYQISKIHNGKEFKIRSNIYSLRKAN